MMWDITYKISSIMLNIIVICFTIGMTALFSIILISPGIALVKAGVDKIRNKSESSKEDE